MSKDELIALGNKIASTLGDPWVGDGVFAEQGVIYIKNEALGITIRGANDPILGLLFRAFDFVTDEATDPVESPEDALFAIGHQIEEREYKLRHRRFAVLDLGRRLEGAA